MDVLIEKEVSDHYRIKRTRGILFFLFFFIVAI